MTARCWLAESLLDFLHYAVLEVAASDYDLARVAVLGRCHWSSRPPFKGREARYSVIEPSPQGGRGAAAYLPPLLRRGCPPARCPCLCRSQAHRTAAPRHRGRGVQRPDAHPAAGHPAHSRGQGPPRLRADRHGQDRSVHAADPRSASTQSVAVEQEPKLRVLVLTPTRELAAQIGESFAHVRQGARPVPDTRSSSAGWAAPADGSAAPAASTCCIATPGRLLDLCSQRHRRRSVGSSTLVLDEADRMLDMGFIPDMKRVTRDAAEKRQTLLFSATMPPDIRKLADTHPAASPVQRRGHARSPRRPSASTSGWSSSSSGDKRAMLERRAQGSTRAPAHIVFTRTKHGANRVVQQLSQCGHRGGRHPREQVPGRARAGARVRSSRGRRACSSRPTSRRAASTSTTSRT